MRALFLFLIVVVAFLLVLRFYPTSGVEAEDAARGTQREALAQAGQASLPGPEPAAAGGVRFLTRPEDGAGAPYRGARSAESVRPVEAAAEPLPEERDGRLPSWLEGIEAEPVRAGGEAELALARSILHGSLSDVARALGDPGLGWSDERCLMILAFKEALEGRRDQALEHLEGLGGDVAWSGGDQERVRAALTGSAVDLSLAAARAEGATGLAMEMALAAREAPLLAQERAYARAAQLYSQLLLSELDAPWEADRAAVDSWSAGLNAAQDHHRLDPRGSWPSVEMVVEEGDSLTVIRKRYLERHPGRLMCTGLIAAANALRGYLQPGQKLRIPTDPVEVLVDLGARRVLILMGPEVVRSYEVGVGRQGQETIVGSFTAGEKQENPSWFPLGKPMVPFGDPRNPLGTRWISWERDGGKTSYGFHGTSDPESIGRAASDGCIRFRNEEVEEFFELVPVGCPILVRP